jgi:hypothetical protein
MLSVSKEVRLPERVRSSDLGIYRVFVLLPIISLLFNALPVSGPGGIDIWMLGRVPGERQEREDECPV